MIELICGTRRLRLTPYERECNPDDDDWINVWIEFFLPELQTEFKTAFTVYELSQLKHGVENIYQSMISSTESSPVNFESLENRINISFRKIHPDHVEVNLTLRPEEHADSVKVTDTFYLDQSYFPALLSGLDEMINWQN
ncbi:WapI family immunity protein [Kosakonia oryziphila]|uniref:Uncharacterized protein n=1 Tax=Kosakonia oryziphila TaxID=1005667 RepID=A0A1C4E5X7_9ENTR|nr:hypothetical protein [Kosakonia oryziphila]SCC38892.1 hypothetical protein GA0061070_102074 [Kosakonia oryziphila]